VVSVGNVTVTCTALDASGMSQTESFVVVMASRSLPATGGTLRMLPWAALVVLAGCALVIVTQRRRRLA
jgi:LPXTG-motif cell wall-anchored protein